MFNPFKSARRVAAIFVAAGVVITGASIVSPGVADAASDKCKMKESEVFAGGLFSDDETVKPLQKIEYTFTVENLRPYTCTETVAFHFPSEFLTINSVNNQGKVSAANGQVVWGAQKITGDPEKYEFYQIVATIKKTAPKRDFLTFATATISTAPVPKMISTLQCNNLYDVCDFTSTKVLRRR